MKTFCWAAWTLAEREVVRFLRQRNRVIGAIATPLVFWLILGSGLGTAFRPEWAQDGTSYLEYFLPGTIVLQVMFTAIFATLSIIEDRREGFLQGVLASPAPRGAIVVGRVLGGATLATLQGVLMLALAPLVGIPLSTQAVVGAAAAIAMVGFMLTAVGFVTAWPSTSVQGYHAIMNLFLMPMWLLSGALFTTGKAAGWVSTVVEWNPLYYGLCSLRYALYPSGNPALTGLPPLGFCIGITLALGLVLCILGTFQTRRLPGRVS